MIAIEALRIKIETLQQELECNSPGYKQYLGDIHSALRADPELVHILDPEKDLHILFEAMRKYKNVEIPITEQKKKMAAAAQRGPVSLDEF